VFAALTGTEKKAAQVYDQPPGPGWLARNLCSDQRLTGAIDFSKDGTNYRRVSCCLYYRTPTGGLCGDCVLTTKPGTKPRKEAS
jgi:iron complex transport system ATP-binding protein